MINSWHFLLFFVHFLNEFSTLCHAIIHTKVVSCVKFLRFFVYFNIFQLFSFVFFIQHVQQILQHFLVCIQKYFSWKNNNKHTLQTCMRNSQFSSTPFNTPFSKKKNIHSFLNSYFSTNNKHTYIHTCIKWIVYFLVVLFRSFVVVPLSIIFSLPLVCISVIMTRLG